MVNDTLAIVLCIMLNLKVFLKCNMLMLSAKDFVCTILHIVLLFQRILFIPFTHCFIYFNRPSSSTPFSMEDERSVTLIITLEEATTIGSVALVNFAGITAFSVTLETTSGGSVAHVRIPGEIMLVL